jgi:simple sugar transport system permease protein
MRSLSPPKDSPLAAAASRLLPSMASVTLSLLVCFLVIALTQSSLTVAADAYAQMVWGGLGDWPSLFAGGDWSLILRPWGESATKASLLILTGLSVSLAFCVGLFNIGAQGQLMVGAIAAAFLGAKLALPGGVHPLACMLGAAICGALYALVPAVLKLRRGVHEVISTIMLNWIAVSLVESWLVVGPLRASSSGTLSRAGTDEILTTAQLPRVLGSLSRLNAGFLLAICAVLIVSFWLARSSHGFEVRAVGLGFEAARTAGIEVNRRIYQAMAGAGALAGLAGAVLVLGTEYKYPASLGAPYGFDGIAIALLGQNHPVGICAAAVFFGILRAGGTRMQLLGVHKSFPELIQGLALLFVAGQLIWTKLLARTQKSPTPAAELPRV